MLVITGDGRGWRCEKTGWNDDVLEGKEAGGQMLILGIFISNLPELILRGKKIFLSKIFKLVLQVLGSFIQPGLSPAVKKDEQYAGKKTYPE